MDNKTIQRRRRLWWELYSANVMVSIQLGRPISIHHIYIVRRLSGIATQYPDDVDVKDCPLPDSLPDFDLLKYTLIQQIMVPVLEVRNISGVCMIYAYDCEDNGRCDSANLR